MSRVTFSAEGIDDVTVLLGETPAQVTSGYGGWTVVSRQRRKGLTQWDGKDPLRMQIAILFDGYRDRVSQEIPISHLSRMALPPVDGEEPPVVTVDGPALPMPGPDSWVIESLNWGTKVEWDFARNGVMSRLRQDCTVNLLEFVDEDRVAFKNLSPGTGTVTASGSSSGWPKQYIAKAGDTLRSIAVAFYKDATKWQKIATANGLRDSKAVTAGMLLRIPAP